MQVVVALHVLVWGVSFRGRPIWTPLRHSWRWVGRCVACGSPGTEDNPLHCDHIKPTSKFPELANQIDNLQTLCMKCNISKGNRV
jgi:5-methylcytosine-specific restriction endonuclease McrA